MFNHAFRRVQITGSLIPWGTGKFGLRFACLQIRAFPAPFFPDSFLLFHKPILVLLDTKFPIQRITVPSFYGVSLCLNGEKLLPTPVFISFAFRTELIILNCFVNLFSYSAKFVVLSESLPGFANSLAPVCDSFVHFANVFR